jgi:lysophospholipase
MAFKKITGNFKSTVDELNLYYCAFMDKNFNHDKCIIVQHGFGEHSGRYQNVVDIFEKSGYSLFIIDMRGHGLSEGLRGSAPDFEAYIKDLHSFITYVKNTYKISKPVLLGHSMRGLIALSYCLVPDYVRNIKALVANGSLLSFQFTPMIFMKRIFGNMISAIFPELRVSVGLNLNFISHDKNVVQAYKDDPLVHGLIKIKVADEIIKKSKWCLDHASELKIPVLLTHGEKDGLSNAKGTIEFYEKCSSVDKTLIVYEGLYHEVYNEIEKEKPLNDLRKWIENHS